MHGADEQLPLHARRRQAPSGAVDQNGVVEEPLERPRDQAGPGKRPVDLDGQARVRGRPDGHEVMVPAALIPGRVTRPEAHPDRPERPEGPLELVLRHEHVDIR